MQALIPNKLKILNNSVPETEAPLWDESASYAEGDRVIQDHYVYEAVEASTGKQPSGNADMDGAPWRTISVTNKYACIDIYGYTQTVAPEGATELVIKVPFDRPATGFGLLNMRATKVEVSITDVSGSEVVWDGGAISLLENSRSIWHYLFDSFRYIKDLSESDVFDLLTYRNDTAFTSLPPRTGVLNITLRGNRPAIGTVVVGETVSLGLTQYGPTFGFKDFSVATMDEYGNPVYRERKKAKIGTFTVFIPPEDLDYIQQRIMDIGKRPTLWLGDDGKGFQSMIIFGRLKEYSPTLAAYGQGNATFDIEGFV